MDFIPTPATTVGDLVMGETFLVSHPMRTCGVFIVTRLVRGKADDDEYTCCTLLTGKEAGIVCHFRKTDKVTRIKTKIVEV